MRRSVGLSVVLMQHSHGLTKLMKAAEIGDSELGLGIGADRATVWRWTHRGTRPSGEHVDALLAFFSKRLGRSVTYEEAFGSPKRRKKAA